MFEITEEEFLEMEYKERKEHDAKAKEWQQEEAELKNKAEKYLKENCCEICILADDCAADTINCFSKDCYIKGFIEGRNETRKEEGILNKLLSEKNAELTNKLDKALEANVELSEALEASESREKELCIFAENLKAKFKKIQEAK